MESLVNKVADSGIVTLNLEDYYPKEPVALFDLKDYLFMGLILKEKDFRESLKQLDTAPYAGKLVAVTCSADAIIPVWAYMLVASLLQPVSAGLVYADEATAPVKKLLENIQQLDVSAFTDQRIVLKGCGELPIPEEAYIKATERLRPVAKSIMYGEPCSTVPVYKKKTTA
jgi:hypothetical protein